jgi:hypothetical protein
LRIGAQLLQLLDRRALVHLETIESRDDLRDVRDDGVIGQ